MTARVEHIPTLDTNPFPLGRHINHDEASKAFPAQLASNVLQVRHYRGANILDQGQVGSCTGNALAGAIGTQPNKYGVHIDEALALKFYTRATEIDPWPGSYPSEDTGSDGISVCKAAIEFGYIKAYDHAFGLENTLLALTLRPVIIGIPWYDSMFDVDDKGFVVKSAGASLAGGHELCLDAIRMDLQAVVFANSWGAAWGRNGRAYMSFTLLDSLLTEGGDCTVPRY